MTVKRGAPRVRTEAVGPGLELLGSYVLGEGNDGANPEPGTALGDVAVFGLGT